MTISLTQVITNLQADIDAVDSDTSMDQILKYMHRARSLTEINSVYDSAGVMPTDSAYDGMLAFSKSDNTMYKFVDSSGDGGTIFAWHQADRNVAASAGGTTTNLQGATSVYKAGGSLDLSPYGTNTIEKVPVASDGNMTDVGDLAGSGAIGFENGNSSSTDGFASGGRSDAPTYQIGGGITQIDKFPFATDTNATDVGDLQKSRGGAAVNNGPTHGYQSGGASGPAAVEGTISKFPYAISSATGTSVGNLDPRYNPGSYGLQYGMGSSDTTHGYIAVGNTSAIPYPTQDLIQRFPFASDDDATDVGDASITGRYAGNNHNQSSTHGYIAGGLGSPADPGWKNDITKFPFAASGANAADVGDLTLARYGMTGASSTTHAYAMAGNTKGGSYPSPTDINVVDKYSTASDANATDVGDTSNAHHNAAGAQI